MGLGGIIATAVGNDLIFLLLVVLLFLLRFRSTLAFFPLAPLLLLLLLLAFLFESASPNSSKTFSKSYGVSRSPSTITVLTFFSARSLRASLRCFIFVSLSFRG